MVIDTFDLYFNEVFASGNNFVYSLCKDNELKNCNELLGKIYKIRSETEEEDKTSIEKETEYMKTAFDLGVSPEFVGIQYCEYDGKKYAILIMKNYGDGSLTTLLKNGEYNRNKESIDIKLKQLLDTLYDSKIDQNDLHSDNFLYRMNADEIEFKIIDFDNATDLDGRRRMYIIENLNRGGTDINVGRGHSKRRPRKYSKKRKTKHNRNRLSK